jgi:hypothetical protein
VHVLMTLRSRGNADNDQVKYLFRENKRFRTLKIKDYSLQTFEIPSAKNMVAGLYLTYRKFEFNSRIFADNFVLNFPNSLINKVM